jgi:hypothetical protein
VQGLGKIAELVFQPNDGGRGLCHQLSLLSDFRPTKDKAPGTRDTPATRNETCSLDRAIKFASHLYGCARTTSDTYPSGSSACAVEQTHEDGTIYSIACRPSEVDRVEHIDPDVDLPVP